MEYDIDMYICDLDKEKTMFNVTVLKMKDIKKYFIGMLVTLIVVIIASKYLSQTASKERMVEKVLSKNSMLECLGQTVTSMSSINEDYKKIVNEEDEINEENLLQGVLKTQISSIQGMETIEEKTKEAEEKNTEENIQNDKEEESESIQVAEIGLATQVITNNPIKESYNTQYGKVKIKNETEYPLTEDILKPDISIENKNIVLFHTHSCESYTSSPSYPYAPTGTFRTTDLNYTVTRVGTELENQLKQYQYNVIHDTSYHDYPAYNGSYARSLATVENILKTTPSDIVIDLHRDAIGSRSDYAPSVKIGENDIAAQIMFVIRDK